MIFALLTLAPDLPESSYAWAERLTRTALPVMRMSPEGGSPQFALADARDAWSWLLAKGGSPARIVPKVAQIDLEMGEYERVGGLVQKYGDLAKVSGEEAVRRKAIAGSVALPQGFTKLRAVPLGTAGWVVLAGIPEPDSLFGRDCSQVRLFVGRPGNWKPLPLEERSSSEQTLITVNFDGKGMDEIVLQEVDYGGSATPSYTTVFAHVGGAWRRVAQESGHDPMEIHPHGAGFALRWVNAVADGMSHAEMPRWMRARTLSGGKWIDVSNQYASENRQMRQEIIRLMKEHPTNSGLADYMGRVEWRLARPSEARRWWRIAASRYEKDLTDKRWTEIAGKPWIEATRRHISLLRAVASGRRTYQELDRVDR